jgi:hypothetical protein
VELVLGQVLDAAEAGGVHPEDVEGRLGREALEQVRAGHPRAAAGLVDDDGGPRQLPGVAPPRVHDPVLDDPRGRGAGVPEERVEVRDVHEREVGPVRGGVAHLGDPALRRVVLDVDRGDVAAGAPAAEPVLGEVLELVRALEDDDVEVLLADLLGRELPHPVGPGVGLRAPAAVRAAVGQDGHHVVVVAVHEGRRPGPVDVPEQDPHAATSSGARRSTAARTSSVATSPRHG